MSPAPLGERTRTYLLQDELTGTRAIELADRLAALPYDEIDTLVLSLGGVRGVDASGVAILVRLYSRLIRSGKHLILRDIPDGVERVLRRVGLGSVFQAWTRPASGLVEVRPPTKVDLSPVPPAPTPPTRGPAPDDYDPSLEDLADVLSRMEPERAIHLLRTVVERLGLTAERLGLQLDPPASPAPAPVEDSEAFVPAAPEPVAAPRASDGAAASPTEPVTAKAAVLRRGRRRRPQPAPASSAMGVRRGMEPDTIRRPLAGARTESFGWAWWDLLWATQDLPRPAAARGAELPVELRDLLLDYLGLDVDDAPAPGSPRRL